MNFLEKKYSPYLVLFGLSFLFVLPGFLFGSFGSDLIFHQMWALHFSQAFWQGQWYPKWIETLNAGCGSPVFTFYPPLAYYLTSAFRFLNAPYPTGWYPMLMTAWVVMFSGSAFMYAWLLRVLQHRVAAFCAASLYILIPYTPIDFYGFMVFAEFIVVGVLPGLMFFASGLIDNKRWAIAGYGLFFALLLMSNVSGAIVGAGLPIVYVAFSLWMKNEYKGLGRLAIALLLGGGLAAVYVVPMYAGLENVRIGHFPEEMWGGGYNYSSNFLFIVIDRVTPFLNVVLSVVLVCMLFLSVRFFMQLQRSHITTLAAKKQVMFWLVLMGLTFYITTPLSFLIWKYIPLIQIVQFPRRFCLIISVIFSVIFAFYVKMRAEEDGHFDMVYFTMCLVMLFAFDALLMQEERRDLSPGPYAEAIDPVTQPGRRVYYALGTSLPVNQEYLPMWTDKAVMQPDEIHQTAALCARKTAVIDGDAKVQVAGWKARDITLAIDAKSASVIEVSQFYYPGWQAVSESGEELAVTPSERYGLLRFTVPAGEHSVNVRLEKSWAEKLGAGISLLSLLLLLLSGGVCRKRSPVIKITK